MADLKTKQTEASVDAFLDGIEDEQKRQDSITLMRLMQGATGAPARMWGPNIVGFGSYHYVYESGREGDWFLTGFSPRKQNLSLYIMGGFSRYDALLERLGKHKTGKACLYVNRLADVDLDVLRELVEQSVAHMQATHE